MEKYSYNDPATLPQVHKYYTLGTCSFEVALFPDPAQVCVAFLFAHRESLEMRLALRLALSFLANQSVACMLRSVVVHSVLISFQHFIPDVSAPFLIVPCLMSPFHF